jgi:hypothetical protein
VVIARRARIPCRRVRPLFPILVFRFFFVFVVFRQEVVVFFLFVLKFLGRFDLQRIGPDYAQVGAAFVATDGIAFVYFVFFHIDRATASWTLEHLQFLP